MATIGSYAGKTFKVSNKGIYTLKDGIKMKASIATESQEKENDKPSTYIKGFNLETLSFSITVFKQKNIDPLGEFNSWKKILYSKKPYPFILGGKKLGSNNFLMKDVSMEETKIVGNGEIVKMVIGIELEEYVRAGKKKKEGK